MIHTDIYSRSHRNKKQTIKVVEEIRNSKSQMKARERAQDRKIKIKYQSPRATFYLNENSFEIRALNSIFNRIRELCAMLCTCTQYANLFICDTSNGQSIYIFVKCL